MNRSGVILESSMWLQGIARRAAYGPVGAPDEHVVDRHISQFYLPGQIASNQPLRDLRSAVVRGSTIRQGWRRRADGTTFWGNFVIEAGVLRDGPLQGFSYVTGASNERIPDASTT